MAHLQHLVRTDWARVPGRTLIVLSGDSEGNRHSPFGTFSRARYAPLYGHTGEVYPLESEMTEDKELCELFPEIPHTAVAALVLYLLD